MALSKQNSASKLESLIVYLLIVSFVVGAVILVRNGLTKDAPDAPNDIVVEEDVEGEASAQ